MRLTLPFASPAARNAMIPTVILPVQRHRSTSTAGYLLAIGTGLLLASCAGSSAGPEVAAGPSRIVWVADSYAGGQRVLDSTVVDSLSGRWTVTRCGPVAATAPICRPSDARTTTGTVDTTFRRLLFQRLGRSDFVALRADYAQVGVVPPDLFVQELNVTLNGRVQTVRWRTASAIPVAADSFTCLLQQSMGSLILCAN